MIAPFLDLLFLKTEQDYQDKIIGGQPVFKLSIQSLIDNFYYFFTKIIVDPERGKLYALSAICIIVIVLFFLKNLFRYLAMYFLAPVRNGVVKDIRNELLDKTLKLPLSFYSEERKGDIMSRMTTDLNEIEWSIMSTLEVVFRDPLSIIIFLITMVIISPQLTLFVFVLLPITGLFIGRVGKSLRRTSASGKEKMGFLLSMIEETLSGLRIIKGFTAENVVQKKFMNMNDEYTKVQIRMYRKTDLSSPMSEFLGALVLVVVMYFGGKLVLAPETSLSAAEFITFIAIFSQLIPPAKSFTTAFYNIQKGMASADRIYKILDADEVIFEKANAIPVKDFKKEIEYKNLSFAYRKGDYGWVLKDINLKIPKGKTIALVGQSGSGKTTLADMLPRFYEASQGALLIDGEDLRNMRLNDLRSLMGIVTQESILFNDTVLNNIAFGMENISEADVINAAKVANAHEFIIQMPQGYQTNIGDRGGKLSGGQRQRLSIARAVLKNPPILILDEATSALDTESERLVQEALQNLMKNRTSIIIAHRLSTIQHADEIIVLHKGEIIERGTHNELLEKKNAYKRLYDLQAFM